ncbi:MAG: hypothetical protein ABTQ34_00410 [Bdellovibrionales bacterium]
MKFRRTHTKGWLVLGIIFAFAFALWLPQEAEADMRTQDHIVDGKKITFGYEMFSPPFQIKRDAGNVTVPALKASLRYYELLAQGDIPGASALTMKPDAAKKQWDGVAKSMGGTEAFKKKMAEYFTQGMTVRGVLYYQNAAVLLVDNPDMGVMMTQSFVCQKDGGCLLDDTRETEAARMLSGRVAGDIRNEKLKLPF